MKKIVALLAGGLLAMSAPQAATVTSTAIPHASSSTPWIDNLSLQQFNSALGTLTSVVFNYGGTITSIFREENLNTASGGTITETAVGNLAFGLSLGTLNFSNTISQSVAAFDGSNNFAGPSGFTTTVASTQSGTFTPGSISTFIGTSTYLIPVAANISSFSATRPVGEFSSQPSNTASANINVVYTFTPTTGQVPEPGSLALVGLALAGLGVMRRKSAKI